MAAAPAPLKETQWRKDRISCPLACFTWVWLLACKPGLGVGDKVASTVMLVMSAAVPHHPRVASHAVNDHDRVPSPSHRAAASPPDVTVWCVCVRFLSI